METCIRWGCVAVFAASGGLLGCSELGPVCGGCLQSEQCGEDGRCECRPGFLDCDGLARNGCEVEGDSCDCEPEPDQLLCTREGKDCGLFAVTDRCGEARTVGCGECLEPESCGGAGVANVCGEPACETDTAFCQRLGKDCGRVEGRDDCEKPRAAECGECLVPETCGGAGVANVCGEPACETDTAFCQRLGKDCGTVEGLDDCEKPRTAECGECLEPETCSGAGVANVCGEPACETDVGFCERLGKECGTVEGLDDCEKPRSAECGECVEPEVCGGGGEANVCAERICETDQALCLRLGRSCGPATAVDDCGKERNVQCGECTEPDWCEDGECICVPSPNFEICFEHGYRCGNHPYTDECGEPNSANCGVCDKGWECQEGSCVSLYPLEDESCVEAGVVVDCQSGLSCISNGGQGEDKIAVCKRKCADDPNWQCKVGETCALGQLGRPQEGICGLPAARGEACEGFFGSPRFCWEAAKPAGTALDCLGSVCRYLCNWDSLPTPLPCPEGLVCGTEQVVYPEYPMWISICVPCVAETDAEFCARLGKDCDEVSQLDNCHAPRTANCGTCEPPAECGGWGEANVCGG